MEVFIMYSVQQASVVNDYGSFFYQWPWDHYATLTFGRKLSPSTCHRHWNEFIHSLGCLTRARIGWVRADEERWSGCGQPDVPLHFHALLIYKHPPKPEAVAALWQAKAGDALVEEYLRGGGSGGGAAWYLAKQFPYEDTRYEFGGLDHFEQTEDRPI